MLDRLKSRARRLKHETYALYVAYREPRTPWYARLGAAAVVAYTLSSIDLIPDPIPVVEVVFDRDLRRPRSPYLTTSGRYTSYSWS